MTIRLGLIYSLLLNPILEISSLVETTGFGSRFNNDIKNENQFHTNYKFLDGALILKNVNDKVVSYNYQESSKG